MSKATGDINMVDDGGGCGGCAGGSVNDLLQAQLVLDGVEDGQERVIGCGRQVDVEVTQ